MRYKYQLDNLNCAHCAGKIEAKIAETDGFEDVSFNFATKLLNFKSEKQNPVSEIQAICDSIEDGVTVVDKTPKMISQQRQNPKSRKRKSTMAQSSLQFQLYLL